jgi:hypothetical protein
MAMLKVEKVFSTLFLFGGLLFLNSHSLAQKPVLQFQSDSISFGEPVEVVVYYQHAPSQELIFPDSNFNYAPFEFVSKRYFPTTTRANESLDSVVYTLRTFEDSALYRLSLPITLLNLKDTTKVFSNFDSVACRYAIKNPSDTLKLISNTRFLPVEKEFNYLITLIFFGVLMVMAVFIYILFGKRLWRQVKRYRMKRAHTRFLTAFDAYFNSNELSVKQMEDALSLWKKYIQSLMDKPFTTYTSAEISKNLNKEYLKRNLQHIDAAIYGGRTLFMAAHEFTELRKAAIEVYQGVFTSSKS